MMRAVRPTVLVLYNVPRADGDFPESDQGVLEEVRTVAEALHTLGVPWREASVATLADVNACLRDSEEEIVFNLVESLSSRPEEAALVPALCRAWGKGCTGTDTPGLLLTLDKWQTKGILKAYGMPCPEGQRVPIGQEPDMEHLFSGPYLVKPERADASEGIDATSVVRSPGPELIAAVRRVHHRQRQAALIEAFVEGREVNLSLIWCGEDPTVLPPAEIDFRAFGPEQPRIVGYEAKWSRDSFEYRNTPRVIPAPLTPQQAEQVQDLAVHAASALGCDGYARVDLRLDTHGRPYILEVNANPDLSPEAGFRAALHAAAIPFERFVDALLQQASRRSPKTPSANACSPEPTMRRTAESPMDAITLRPARSEDRSPVLKMIEECGRFRIREARVAEEVFEAALQKPPHGDYTSYVAEQDGRPVGWVCFGPAPCTLASYEVYWIVVSPERQRQGIGRRLMAQVERIVAERQGQQIFIETSGQDSYRASRAFYSRMGYRPIACLRDFYAPHDDMIVFAKSLAPRPVDTVSTTEDKTSWTPRNEQPSSRAG